MLAPIAALFLAFGAASTPAMIDAEVEKDPTIEVDAIQTAQVEAATLEAGELGW